MKRSPSKRRLSPTTPPEDQRQGIDPRFAVLIDGRRYDARVLAKRLFQYGSGSGALTKDTIKRILAKTGRPNVLHPRTNAQRRAIESALNDYLNATRSRQSNMAASLRKSVPLGTARTRRRSAALEKLLLSQRYAVENLYVIRQAIDNARQFIMKIPPNKLSPTLYPLADAPSIHYQLRGYLRTGVADFNSVAAAAVLRSAFESMHQSSGRIPPPFSLRKLRSRPRKRKAFLMEAQQYAVQNLALIVNAIDGAMRHIIAIQPHHLSSKSFYLANSPEAHEKLRAYLFATPSRFNSIAATVAFNAAFKAMNRYYMVAAPQVASFKGVRKDRYTQK